MVVLVVVIVSGKTCVSVKYAVCRRVVLAVTISKVESVTVVVTLVTLISEKVEVTEIKSFLVCVKDSTVPSTMPDVLVLPTRKDNV